MRLLFVGPVPPPMTGQALACQVLLDGLPDGYRPDVVDLSKKSFAQGVNSGWRVAEVLGVLWKVWRRQRRADVIYLTVSESLAGNLKDLGIYVVCWRRLHRLVIHLHGGAGMARLMADGRLTARLNAAFLRRLGAVIILGQSHSAIYRGVVPEARLHIVPNFAQDHLFTTVEQIRHKFARARPLRMLFLSNLLPGKGHLELVEAMAALDADARSRIELHVAGGFESEAHKADFLARIAPCPEIRYHGSVGGQEKADLFAQTHVFCLPTYYPYEGQPISILEAYASGCAVVTTNHSGIPDVFADGVNGYQVTAGSVPELRAAIARALADPDALCRMAEANLNGALTKFRASSYQQAVTEVLEAVGPAGKQW